MSGGEQLRDYLPVAEVARHLVSLRLMDRAAGIVNVCSGTPISVRSLVGGWIEENGWSIRLNLGRYPYPDHEPMAFWGDATKLKQLPGRPTMSRMREIYRAEQLPVFQNRMFATAAAARGCARGDLVLVQDLDTGLVYNQAFDPALMDYDADYQNEQGHSAAFRQHLDAVAALVHKHFGGQTLIEVGCGKGLFLEQLSARASASPASTRPTRATTRPSSASSSPRPRACAPTASSCATCSSTCATRSTSWRSCALANGGGGKIYIEVPCLDWIAAHHAWFDLFYEHVNYFRLPDFERMFARVHEAGRIFGGQYLYVVADLASLRTPVRDGPGPLRHARRFLRRAEPERRAPEGARPHARAPAAVWGGASKGVIFSLFMERAGAPVDTSSTSTRPSRAGTSPPPACKCSRPSRRCVQLRPGDDIFVMNRNYLNEIRDMTAHQFNYITVEHEEL